MAICKICDVRNYKTAYLCAELGADLIGLHCIHGVKEERMDDYIETVERCRSSLPHIGVVAVTLLTDVDSVCNVVKAVRPAYVQLHSWRWSRSAIGRLRVSLMKKALDDVKIIGVVKVPIDEHARVRDICQAVDLLIADRTYYSTEVMQSKSVNRPEEYKRVIDVAHENGLQILLAGGLTVDNVDSYMEFAKPDGIDVQTGVEYEDQKGCKDPDKLRRFIAKVKG